MPLEITQEIRQCFLCTSCRDYPNLARKDHLDNVEERKDTVVQKLRRSVNSWVMFYRHPAFFAVIALASTYMTVLSLDNGVALSREFKVLCLKLINFHFSYLWICTPAMYPGISSWSALGCGSVGWDCGKHCISIPQKEVECDEVL